MWTMMRIGGCLLLALTSCVSGADAISFEQQVKPLLSDKCYSCHGVEKQKGDLRLDSPAAIVKGGKNGTVLVPGKPDKSPMYARTILPKGDDDVMPSKGDLLTVRQTELLRMWILAGASFTDLPAPVVASAAAPAVPAASGTPVVASVPALLPPTTIDALAASWPAPDAAAVKALVDAGASVTVLAKNGAALSIACGHLHEELNDKHLQLIERLADQVLWLDLKGTAVTDAQLRLLPKLKNLARLRLDRTAIGDAGLAQVKQCAHLSYLNLYATKVTDAGLKQLIGLAELRHLYLWQSQVTASGVEQLDKAMPNLDIVMEPELPKPGDEPGAGKGKKGKGKKP